MKFLGALITSASVVVSVLIGTFDPLLASIDALRDTNYARETTIVVQLRQRHITICRLIVLLRLPLSIDLSNLTQVLLHSLPSMVLYCVLYFVLVKLNVFVASVLLDVLV